MSIYQLKQADSFCHTTRETNKMAHIIRDIILVKLEVKHAIDKLACFSIYLGKEIDTF